MKALLIHDADGNITALVAMPPDGPPIALSTGELSSEVEIEDVAGEPGTAERHDNLLNLIQGARVQFERKAKLVRGQAPEEGGY